MGDEEYKNAENAVNAFTKRFKAPDLVISRVPIKVLESFKTEANSDYCGDYGLFLKTLFDEHIRIKMYEGNITNPNEVMEELKRLSSELESLKAKTPEKKTIRTLSGRIIRTDEGE